eukprot:6604996-Prymnesium_polylepis.1
MTTWRRSGSIKGESDRGRWAHRQSGARRSRRVSCSRLSRQRNKTRTTSHLKLARCRGAMS